MRDMKEYLRSPSHACRDKSSLRAATVNQLIMYLHESWFRMISTKVALVDQSQQQSSINSALLYNNLNMTLIISMLSPLYGTAVLKVAINGL